MVDVTNLVVTACLIGAVSVCLLAGVYFLVYVVVAACLLPIRPEDSVGKISTQARLVVDQRCQDYKRQVYQYLRENSLKDKQEVSDEQNQ